MKRYDGHYYISLGRVCVWCGVPVVCVVRGVGPYRRYCDEHVSLSRAAPRSPKSGFPDGAGGGAGAGRAAFWCSLSVCTSL